MAVVFHSPLRHRQATGTGAADAAADAATSPYRSLGDHLREARVLTDAQVEEVLLFQRAHGLRFGEAALSLKLLTQDQLLQALARQFEFPVLPAGACDLAPELVMAHHPFGPAAERFRALRSQLMNGDAVSVEARRALAVLSPHAGDGKSVVAANLAIAFSQLGLRTLLVDANLRQPRLHTLFGIARPAGLAGLLTGRPGDSFYRVGGLPSLSLLPSGACPPNPLELIERPTFTLMLQDWLMRFDEVIVDTPAADAGADARVLATKCGAALIVARPGQTTLAPLQQMVRGLQAGSARLHGVVFNDG